MEEPGRNIGSDGLLHEDKIGGQRFMGNEEIEEMDDSGGESQAGGTSLRRSERSNLGVEPSRFR